MKKITRFGILAMSLAAAFGPARAESYPDRPITLIVPFAPGASADGIARILGKKLSQNLGKPVIVENKPGAGGTTGLIALAKAAPDGYTIAMGATGAIVVNPHLPDGTHLDPQKQLAPLAKVADIPLVLIAGSSGKIKSVQDLINQAKSSPDGVTYGTSGQYTSQHMAGELLASMTKASLVAVPYRGSAPALVDVMGNQAPAAIVDLTSAVGHIKSGKVLALGVTSATRSKLAPDIPTIAESGVPNYAAPAWMGVFAPAKTSPDIVNRLAKELKTVMADKEVGEQITLLAAEPAYLGPAEFKQFIDGESKKWETVIKSMPKTQK